MSLFYECMQCGLPDPYDGDGDGIDSCECERCEYCDGPPLMCRCESDDEYYGDGDPYDWRCCADPKCACRAETVEVKGERL